jgi:hypothetical protein
VRKVLPANWKIAMEAFLESYHEIATHPQLLEWNSDANTQYDVWDRANRLFTLIGVPSPHLGKVDDDAVYEAALGFYSAPGVTDPPSELPAGTGAREAIAQLARNMVTGAVGVDMSGDSISAVLDAVQYWVFPNWCPWASLANALQYRFRPNGDDPHTSIFDVRIMLPAPPGGPRPPAAPVHRLADDEPWSNAPELMGFAQIMEQDEANLRAIQRGLRATVQRGLNFAEHQESRIRHFHALLDGYLRDDEDATMRTQG